MPTPGHTPDRVSVFVDTEPAVFLAGDANYNQDLLVARKVDGVSPDTRCAIATMDRILGLAQERPPCLSPIP